MEEILDYLCQIHKLTSECLAELEGFIKKQEVRKDEIILRVGEINDKLYFIQTGALHCCYYIGEKEVTGWVFFEMQFCVSIGSYYRRVPGEDCMAALEDSVLYYITRDEYEYLCNKYHCFEGLVRRQLQNYLEVFYEHSRFIRKNKASEIIRIAREKLAHLFYRIPRNIIASWLNMEPETFSRNL